MSRVPANARATVRHVVMVIVASLSLAACGTAKVATAHLFGTPSISLSVPLSTVACTASNSCLAVGTSSSTVGPTSVGEYRLPGGRWAPIAVPSSTSSSIVAGSCRQHDCLFGGAQVTGDLFWSYHADVHTVSTSLAPAGGLGVSAISCSADQSCAVIDTGPGSTPRLTVSPDGGATWTTPLSIDTAKGDAVTALACASEFHCMVAATSPAGALNLFTTSDGGATWVRGSAPAPWTSVRSLHCHLRECVAVVSVTTGARFVRTTDFGRRWSGVALPHRANAVACTSMNTCVVAGQDDSNGPWLGVVHGHTVVTVTLQYVPSPLLDVACGTKVCATVGVTTVLALKP